MSSQPFVGDIMMFGGNFAPRDWAFCRGQLMSIAEFNALFALIGTTYGGDGQSTFALPNLQSRVPIHSGTGPGLSTYTQGQTGGVETVTLISQQLPIHTHPALANSAVGDQAAPAGNFWAAGAPLLYSDQTGTLTPMNPAIVSSAGNNLPHDNMLPYLAINFVIALFGIFPTQN